MSVIAQRVRRAVPHFRAPVVGQAVAIVLRALAPISRGITGGGGNGPRGYRREGFPDCERYQVMSGRKDRFDRF